MASAPPPTASPGEELLKRPIYIYDIPEPLLSTLQPREGFEPKIQEEEHTPAPLSDSPEIANTTSCTVCNFHGHTVADLRAHARSDFHAFNLKRKARHEPAVSEAEFERLLEELNESISGSESAGSTASELEEATDNVAELMKRKMKLAADPDGGVDAQVGARGRKQGPGNAPIVWFGSPQLPDEVSVGVYKAVFSNLEQQQASYLPALSAKQLRAPQNRDRHIFMCMIGGGHFAGMVVSLTPKAHAHGTAKGDYPVHVLAHKTFHRYTTRRKQGGSQSSNDNAKGNAHSAGAGIRRYNEAALTAEVRELLCSWRELLDTADLLFIRATGSANRQTLFNFLDSPLSKGDPRIRGFPFSTRRATQSELLRCFTELTRLKISRISAAALDAAATSPPAQKKEKKKEKEKEPELTPEEEDRYTHTYQLQAAIRRQKVQQLLNYLAKNNLDPNFEFYPPAKHHHAPTPLHMAAHLAHPAVISALLTKARANPAVRNADGKTPFELAASRAARDAFRVARAELGEDACAWEDARVPAGLTAAEARVRAEEERVQGDRAERERRELELQRIAEEEREMREMRERVRAEGWGARGRGVRKLGDESAPIVKGLEGLGREEVEMRGVSEEVRRRIERERRARAAEERIRRMQGGR